MLNIFFFPTLFNGFSPEFLNILIIISLLSGVFIIISKNPIVSVLHLIVLFSSISCYLIMLGITFIGLSYLLVYVGAVSILFLFILMLINIRISELLGNTNNSLPLAIITSIFIYYNFDKLFFSNNEEITNNIFKFFEKKEKVLYVTSRF